VHKHLKPQVFLVLLLVGIFVIIANSPAVYSQYLPCNVVSLAPTGPPTVEAGQTLEVITAVTGTCDQSMFYAVRVDLADGRSSQVLSSVVFPYAPVTAGFTVSITNKATAPITLGTWVLQVNAYFIASLNGGVVASAHQLFSVVVVPYSPPTTTTTEQMTTNSTTTLSLMPINSTNQTTSIGETSFATSTSPAASETTGQNSSTFAIVAASLVILAVIAIVMFSKRKRTTTQKPQQSANVKYCVQCGTKLGASDEFCGHCGTKQT